MDSRGRTKQRHTLYYMVHGVANDQKHNKINCKRIQRPTKTYKNVKFLRFPAKFTQEAKAPAAMSGLFVAAKPPQNKNIKAH